MKVFRDDSTGYLVIDDLSEGVDILPSGLYQGYLRRIKELEAEVSQLKDKLVSIAEKQADAAVLQQENTKTFGEILKKTAKTERNLGLAIGLFARITHIPDEAKLYFEEFQILYEEAMEAGRLPEIEAKAKKRCLVDFGSK